MKHIKVEWKYSINTGKMNSYTNKIMRTYIKEMSDLYTYESVIPAMTACAHRYIKARVQQVVNNAKKDIQDGTSQVLDHCGAEVAMERLDNMKASLENKKWPMKKASLKRQTFEGKA